METPQAPAPDGDRWLGQDLAYINTLMSAEDPVPSAPPEPGSSMALDDLATAGYDPLSSQVSGLLHASHDHLHGVKSIVTDAGALHTYAEYALARAGLECAVLAWWLMESASRRERVTRSLRLFWEETLDAGRALAEAEATQSMVKKRREHRNRVAKANGIPVNATDGHVAMSPIIREFSKKTGLPAMMVYQATSGMIHGRKWAMLALSSVEPDDDRSSPMVNVKISGTTRQLGTVLRVAVECERRASRLFRMRCSRPPCAQGAPR